MAIDRRHFLLGAVALPLARNGSLVSARGDINGRYFATRFDTAGRIAWDVELPGRGHGLARAADGSIILFGRRPGSFALVLSSSGQVRARFAPPDGFTFNGHGACIDRMIFATETRDDDSGWIGVYDMARDCRCVAAWPTHGIDPHEVIIQDDVLVVANGGLPDGVPAANASTVEPSLATIDRRDGRLRSLVRPPAELRPVSLRHLAKSGDGIWIAGQEQGGASGRPLVAVFDGAALRYHAPLPLQGYCGSVVATRDAICVTSPRAGRAIILSVGDGNQRAAVELPDVCGAAVVGRRFVVTGGRGDVGEVGGTGKVRVAGALWDNHALPLTA